MNTINVVPDIVSLIKTIFPPNQSNTPITRIPINSLKGPAKFFLLITPKWVYKPELVNIIIGFAEIILALGLILETTRSISAIGIIILLILVFPANVYHLQISIEKKKKHNWNNN